MLVLAGLLACGLSEPPATTPTAGLPLDDARLDATWVVQLVPDEALAPFAQEPGWVTLVVKRDIKSAVAQLGPRGGVAAARAHAEAAALFRQAARLAGESYVQTYAGPSAQPTDPAGTAHLVSVGHGLGGDLAAARTASTQARSLDGDPTRPWHAPWAIWLDRGTGTPDLGDLPLELPPPSVGGWPELGAEPQYALTERSERRATRDVGDPLALVALGEWHAQAARLAAPELEPALDRLRAAQSLYGPPPASGEIEVPIGLLFGGDLLVSGDVDFLAAVRRASSPGDVRTAMATHRDDSVVAAIAEAARTDDGLDPARVVDLAEDLRQALLARAAAARGGPEQGQDVQFADMARTGLLRSVGLVAEGLGDREVSGRILLAAWDTSHGAAADPVGRLWFATWDVTNRYPLRAAQTIHQESQRTPSLTAARLAVDVLNLRVNRENVGQGPN
ncbi:MAG: hypothetical protein AAF602_18270 [Myxococcota bacterium]